MRLRDKKGRVVPEGSVRGDYMEQYKKSVAYLCQTQGHQWPEEPRPGESKLVCKRCRAELELGDEEEEQDEEDDE